MHISFDFDYTLADSSEGTIISANYALGKLGYSKRTAEDIRKTIGLNLTETYKALAGNNREEDIAAFYAHFLEKAEEAVLPNIRFFDDVEAILTELKSRGHYLSIVSTKFTGRIQAALERDRLAHLIDYVVGGDRVSETKPSPEGIIMAMERSSVPKEQTIYVGDSKSDAAAAHAAGIQFVAVLSGVTNLDDLKAYQPYRVLIELCELIEVVDSFSMANHCESL